MGTPGCRTQSRIAKIAMAALGFMCTPGEFVRCEDPQNLVTCDASGTRHETFDCAPNDCNASTGQCNVCMPGVTSGCADADHLIECNEDGTISGQRTCEHGCNAGRRACNVCTPDAFLRCKDATTLERCKADGSGPEDANCGALGCNAGAMRCNVCNTADPPVCNSNDLVECVDGLSQITSCALGCINAACCR